MGHFSAEWLSLREPADHAARSSALTRDILGALPAGELRILDLACGTGSNLRYLCGQILHVNTQLDAERQDPRSDPDFLLVDHDPSLLALVPSAANVTTLERDLTPLDADLFDRRSLVTASALLDLVSEPWLRALVLQCRAHGAAGLFALTYDGRITFEPAEPEDALVRDLVNQHQRTDKGFGPALGPAAVAGAVGLFRSVGYDVRTAPSDWRLSRTSASDALQNQLIDGWAEAAGAVSPDKARSIDGWRWRRRDHVAAGRSLLIVGHHDLAAVPSHDARHPRLDAVAAAV
jgi:SAM-dependent methyltransferase